ncbi:MAG: hypothetical protein AAGJ79_11940 [Verrucomicrobiota bacterium]
MKNIWITLLSVCALSLLASCNSTSAGGNSYEYSAAKVGKSRTISAASVDGRFVILDDGSIWNINWSDARNVSRWRSGQTVSVSPSSSSNFPYILNHQNGTSVSARHGKKLD